MERRRRVQLRRRMLREVHQAVAEERAADLERAALRLRAGECDARSAYARSRLQRRQQDGEYARGISGGLHRKRRDSRDWRASEECRLPDGGCVRRAASDREIISRAGYVSLLLGIYGEGGRDRSRCEGTIG